MAATTTRFLLDLTPQRIVAPEPTHRVVRFTTAVPSPIFIGLDSSVNAMTSLPLANLPLPLTFPVTAGQELWAVAQVQSPIVAFVTVDDGPLTNEELRASPLPVIIEPSIVPLAPTSATVGLTSTPLVAANLNRRGLHIKVLTDKADVALSFSGAALAGKGIVLTGGGSDTFEMNEFTFTTNAVTAISSIAGTAVAIQEFN